MQILSCLVEGNSVRATCRITGAAKGTVLKFLEDVGVACAAYQDDHLRNLWCEKLQLDEIWAFCYSKAKNVPAEHRGELGYGDVWTWVAIDADSKLVPAFAVGNRDAYTANAFIQSLASRLAYKPQITTDGNTLYLTSIERVFGANVDFAQLIKIYGEDAAAERRYSPATFGGTKTEIITGNPDEAHISTSYVERQNLTMRMGMRRFTRLTNGFSKKVDNLACAVSLHFMHYNFARPHKTFKGRTPAMAAGISDHVWRLDEIVKLVELAEQGEFSHSAN